MKMKNFREILEKIFSIFAFKKLNDETEHFRKKSAYVVTGFIFTGLFIGLIANLVVFLEKESYDVIGSEFNGRQDILEQRNIRGAIVTREGDILAQSVEKGDGEYERVYPYSQMFAHAVGFADHGQMGIENIANMRLIQSNNSISERVNNDIEQRKNTGDTVVTTLNTRLQEVSFKSLGAYKGAIIVTEVETGAVLAMVSKPDFDPNEIATNWEKYINDEESSVLVNRVTQGLYPPGSTFKILDSIGLYRQNTEGITDYTYHCTGKLYYGQRKITCYHGTSHGTVDLPKAFAKSCNSAFANIGLNLDSVTFAEDLKSLLFHSVLPGPFVHSQSSVEIGENSDETVIVQTSIGQGTTLMTPYHLNLITCAIANDGVLMEPMIISSVKNTEGKTIKEYESKTYDRLLTGAEASYMKDLMIGVVTEGTAKRLLEAEYTSAGKTGSAESGTNPEDSHAWFTGFAPAEDPKVAVTIIIENAGTGGDYAVPVAKRLFDAYFSQYPLNE